MHKPAQVSRRDHFHLIVLEYPDYAGKQKKYLVNRAQSRNQPMIDVDTEKPEFNFFSDEVLKFTFYFYFSKSSNISGRKLEDENNRCFKGRRKVVRCNALNPLILFHVDSVPQEVRRDNEVATRRDYMNVIVSVLRV